MASRPESGNHSGFEVGCNDSQVSYETKTRSPQSTITGLQLPALSVCPGEPQQNSGNGAGGGLLWKLLLRFYAAPIAQAVYEGITGLRPDGEATTEYAKKLVESRNLAGMIADMLSSDRFRSSIRNANLPELVREISVGLLGREPDQETAQAYTSIISEHGELSAVLARIAHSDQFWSEILGTRADQFVQEIYQCLLGRKPDPRGKAAYSSLISATGGLSGTLRALLNSGEFEKRVMKFRRLPNPSVRFGEPCPVFLHIQKTAGTSMQNHLRDCFGERLFSEHSDSLFQYAPGELSVYDAFAGHFNFDSLRFIPRQTLSIFTFLREPQKRLLSLYYFLRAHEPTAKNFNKEMEFANKLDIEDFFEHPHIRARFTVWNHMCWAIMGQSQWQKWWVLLTEKKDPDSIADIIETTIRPAIRERLEEFAFVGLQDDFDRSVELLFRTVLHKKPPATIRTDHSLELLMSTQADFKKNMEKQPLTPRLDAALESLIQLDRVVYEEGKKLYAELSAETDSAQKNEVPSKRFRAHIRKASIPDIVREISIGLFGREPDEETVRAYTTILSAQGGLPALVSKIVRSDEFWAEILGSRSGKFVEEMYHSLLGRDPDPGGLTTYSGLIGTTGSLSGTLDSLIESEEFTKHTAGRKPMQHPSETEGEPCAVFLHIQKTAGTSLQNHLRDCFGEKLFAEHDDSLYRHAPGELSAYDIFAGHFNYDSLKFIPRQTLSIFTFLREPRARLSSLYYFLRAHEPTAENFNKEMELANSLNIEDFFEHQYIRNHFPFWNHMCWAIMGRKQWLEWRQLLAETKDESTIAETMERVIRPAIRDRLEEFAFIGLQEDFGRSVGLLFRTVLQKEAPTAIRTDHSLDLLMRTQPNFKKSMEKQPRTPRLDAVLAPLIQLDSVVYEEGKQLYTARLADPESHTGQPLPLDRFRAKIRHASAPKLVKEISVGLLGRELEKDTTRAYASILSEEGELSAILAQIVKSDAFWSEILSTRSGMLVQDLYRSLMGREPDSGGLEIYSRLITATGGLKGTLDAFVESSEFTERVMNRRQIPHPAVKYSEPCWIFLHMQRTAGTSIQNHLRESFGDKFFAEHGDTLYRHAPGRLSCYDVFAGHFNFDSLRFIPRQSLSLFTFLREPKERLLSLYYFLRAHEPGADNFDLQMDLANRLNAEDFFEHQHIRTLFPFWNHMCWSIMGHRQWQEWFSTLAQAKDTNTTEKLIEEKIRPAIVRRLEKFAFIGLQEDFDSSVQRLFRIMGQEPPATMRTDHSLELLMSTQPNFRKSMEKQPETPRLGSVLESLIQLDRVVYEEGKRIYAERMSKSDSEPPNPRVDIWTESVETHSDRFVMDLYRGLLGRAPDPSGLKAYSELISATGRLSDTLNDLVGSNEFSQRFIDRRKLVNPAGRYGEPCVVFLHIQKTAGTSIQNHLHECYGKKLFREHGNSLYKRAPGELPVFDAFAGHFNYDSLRFIPRQKLSIFTFLREPKQRLISLYYFLRAHEPEHRNYSAEADHANRLMIEDFFESSKLRGDWGFDDHMCCVVMGRLHWKRWKAILSAQESEKEASQFIESVIRPAVIARLKEFVFIGLQEDFSRGVNILFQTIGKESPAEARMDHTLEKLMQNDAKFKRHMEKQPVTPRLIAALEALTKLDRVVYEEGKTLYAERLGELDKTHPPQHIKLPPGPGGKSRKSSRGKLRKVKK